MPRKKSADVYVFTCLSKSRVSKDACPGVFLNETDLLDALVDMLLEALDTALGKYALSLEQVSRQEDDLSALRSKITSRRQEIQRVHGLVRSLYENLIQGVLTEEEYFSYKEKYEKMLEQLATEVEQLEQGLHTAEKQAQKYQALAQDTESIRRDRNLTAALIDRLIERIDVSPDKQISVCFRFDNEFESSEEVLNRCRAM